MKTVRVTKLFKEKYASIRSHIVDECLKNDESLKVLYKENYMVLTPKMLMNEKTIINPKPFKSRFPGVSEYFLYDYKWEPVSNKQEGGLFDGDATNGRVQVRKVQGKDASGGSGDRAGKTVAGVAGEATKQQPEVRESGPSQKGINKEALGAVRRKSESTDKAGE